MSIIIAIDNQIQFDAFDLEIKMLVERDPPDHVLKNLFGNLPLLESDGPQFSTVGIRSLR